MKLEIRFSRLELIVSSDYLDSFSLQQLNKRWQWKIEKLKKKWIYQFKMFHRDSNQPFKNINY